MSIFKSTIFENRVCIHCHQRADMMAVEGILYDLGCRGSCEHVMECSNSPDGQHEIYSLDKLDKWKLQTKWKDGWNERSGNWINKTLYVPKGTLLPSIWKYIKQQYPDRKIKILGKIK